MQAAWAVIFVIILTNLSLFKFQVTEVWGCSVDAFDN
jgi:hypothetical protein